MVDLVEPADDGRVIGRGVRERLAREHSSRLGAERTGGAQLVDHARVVARIDEHADVRVVLRRRPHHRRATDVDELDTRFARERVQVHRDESERFDAVRVEISAMRRIVEVGEDATVHLRVQRDDAMAEHDR